MAQHLSTLAALGEDHSSIPSSSQPRVGSSSLLEWYWDKE